MNGFARVCLLVILGTSAALAADQNLIESTKAPEDIVLTTDPTAAFWQAARPVYAERDSFGKLVPGHRTEIRSRWTKNNLYFLFICPYEKLNLKPSPKTETETYELWNWDVAEVFIGADFQNIRRYQEFEVSPQGEWVDLDIDLAKPHHEEGWTWNSGFHVAARIDHEAKTWYAAMRIPLSAIDRRPPAPGLTFRINLFHSQGPAPDHKSIAWQAPMTRTFHTPERFGVLKLVD
jgi:hypothetical protein